MATRFELSSINQIITTIFGYPNLISLNLAIGRKRFLHRSNLSWPRRENCQAFKSGPWHIMDYCMRFPRDDSLCRYGQTSCGTQSWVILGQSARVHRAHQEWWFRAWFRMLRRHHFSAIQQQVNSPQGCRMSLVKATYSIGKVWLEPDICFDIETYDSQKTRHRIRTSL